MQQLGPKAILIAIAATLALGPTARYAGAAPAAASEDPQLAGGALVKPLDGAEVRSIERLASTASEELSLSAGILPFNAYTFGFEGTAGFAKYFDDSTAWEIINGSYVFSVDKSLTKQLAQDYGVTPQQINRLKSLVTSNVFMAFLYGKGIFLKKYIRYYRASLILGGGMAQSTERVQAAVNTGLKVDFYVSPSLSWRFEFRNAFAFGGGDTSVFPSFSLGVGIGL